MTVVKIRAFISEDEARFWRDYAHYAMDNPSHQIRLGNKKNLNMVDRKYYSINSPFPLFDKVRKIAEENWKEKITFRPDSYAHIMHYLKDSEGLKWHSDGNMGYVSASINITPDYMYEGGEFEIEAKGDFSCKYREIILYDRLVKHRVKPLLGGEKMSLVLWLPKVGQDPLDKGFQWKYE